MTRDGAKCHSRFCINPRSGTGQAAAILHPIVILEESRFYRDDEESGGEGIITIWYNCEQMKEYYVYIMSSERGTLYTGVTNNLEQRVYQHKKKLIDGFTKKYNITQLVYFESTDDVTIAIAREKQIKRMLRSKKIDLIKTMNPQWQDLSEGWFDNDVNKISSPPPDSSSPWGLENHRGTPE